MKNRLIQLQILYLQHRHRFSPVLFIGSFLLDLKIVKRPDSIETILFICVYLILTTTLIVVSGRAAHFDMTQNNDKRWSPSAKLLLDIALQFSFGALASALFVLYFKGADILMSGIFVAILGTFLLGNEFAHKHTSKLGVRFVSTVFLVYVFLIYFIPLIRGKIGFSSTIIATVLSAFFVFIFSILVRYYAKSLYLRSRYIVGVVVAGMLICLPISIHTGIIPPLPLLLQEGTIVHKIERNISSEYVVAYEHKPFWQRLGLPGITPTYTLDNNSTLSFFTSIYAPVDMHVSITHVWEHYDIQKRGFLLRAAIPLSISGGRLLGYRTFSTISALEEGVWRVTATLGTGQILGHRTFLVRYGYPILVTGYR